MKEYGNIWRVSLGKNEIIDQGRSNMDISINVSHCFFSRNTQYP